MPAAKGSSTRKPLVLARRLLLALARRRLLLALARRRLPAAKSSSTSKPLVPARRLLLALARRRLLLTLARRRLHVANAPLKHTRRLPPNSSSCGSGAVVSMPGSLARPHGDSSARPLLPASTTRTNASLVRCRRRSSVCRWPPHKPRHSPMRLKSDTGRLRRRLENNAVRPQPRGRNKRLMNDVPRSPRPSHSSRSAVAKRHYWRRRPTYNVATRKCWRQRPVLAAEADVQRRHEEVLAAEADVQRCHEEVLATEAEVQRRHEVVLAAEADIQRRHEEVLAAEAADVQRWHESAARAAESNAVIACIRTEFALCAAPLDAKLAEIAC